jgi:hypothetical protein
VTPFARQPEPDFWAAKEKQWLDLAPAWGDRDPLNGWQKDKLSLGTWVRDLVRAPGEPRLCA